MAQINACLKRTFIIFNVIFAGVASVIILFALLAQFYTHNEEDIENRTTGLILMYAVGIITMVIAILGAYGAHKENKGALISFLVCMVIGCLITLRGGIYTALARPKLEGVLDDAFRQFVPLDDHPEHMEMVESMQASVECCGLYSYEDWKKIPDSCLCNPQAEYGTCLHIYEEPASSRYMMLSLQKKFVHAKPCLPIIVHYVQLLADIVIGIAFGLACLALLGMALSSLMIHQLRHPNRATVLVTVPAIFTPQSPKYQELQNLPAPPKYQELQNLQAPPKYQELQNPPHYTEY